MPNDLPRFPIKRLPKDFPTEDLTPLKRSKYDFDPPEQKEREYECLERCMKVLTPGNRELMLEYYKEEKHAKIVHRRELATRLGVAVNALRIRAYRIRAGLQGCVENCLHQEA